nr:uncharacterized protein LOC115259154 [Aedes albopictus]
MWRFFFTVENRTPTLPSFWHVYISNCQTPFSLPRSPPAAKKKIFVANIVHYFDTNGTVATGPAKKNDDKAASKEIRKTSSSGSCTPHGSPAVSSPTIASVTLEGQHSKPHLVLQNKNLPSFNGLLDQFPGTDFSFPDPESAVICEKSCSFLTSVTPKAQPDHAPPGPTIVLSALQAFLCLPDDKHTPTLQGCCPVFSQPDALPNESASLHESDESVQLYPC